MTWAVTDAARSRAMAIAAQEGIIYVYGLKSREEMRQELAVGSGLNPINEVCCCRRVYLPEELTYIS